MKYALGTIVGTALLGLAKRNSGSSVRIGKRYEAEYSYNQGFFNVETKELPFDMSNYTIKFGRNGRAIFPETYGLWERSIRNFFDEIQDDEYTQVVEKAFGLRECEDITAYIQFADEATFQAIQSRHSSTINKNGRIIGFALEIFFEYSLDTMDKNLVPTVGEVEDRFEAVSEEIVDFLRSKIGITLNNSNVPIMLDDEDDNVTTVVQNQKGEWVPYKPKLSKSKLRKR